MTIHEFKERTSRPVSSIDYAIIEKVYNYHPCIDAVKGKDQIANLYETFGMRIIKDMLPTAERAAELESKIRDTQRELEQLRYEYDALRKG